MSVIVVAGGSKGLGEAFCLGLPNDGDTVYCLSRSEPNFHRSMRGVKYVWIPADLSKPNAISSFASQISDPIDLLLS